MLLTGIAAGVTGSGLTSVSPGLAQQPQSQPSNPLSAASDLFDYDGNFQTGGENRTDPTTFQPLIPYDRALSDRLILCTSLAIEQFQAGEADDKYDGSIRGLPGYSSQLDGYTQVAAFDSFLSSPNLLGDVGQLFDRILNSRRRRIFIGFALASPQHTIVAFRGTSNPAEWINNLRTNQSSFVYEGTSYGNVHRGFLNLYKRLNEQIFKAAQTFDTNRPCYFTGHSLGGALATLAAAEITLRLPALKPQAQLYTYASPRVGDLDFTQFYRQQVPNSYRVLNLCDTVPMTPPSRIRQLEFVHVGQPWMFLSQTGDIAPNHAIPLYQTAIAKAVETNQIAAYGLS
jgi:hypothetical protein